MVDILNNIADKYDIKVNQIVECGSRDLLDAVALNEAFDARVLAIECNPETLPICRHNLINGIVLDERCINSYSGECDFYQIDTELTVTPHRDGNPGASSIFEAAPYPHEKYIQRKIKVPCETLGNIVKDHNIKKVDLLWMDLQGAEKIALEGIDFTDIDIIMTEVEFKPMYKGQPLFGHIHGFLKHDFFFEYGNLKLEWFTDVVYVNKKYERQVD